VSNPDPFGFGVHPKGLGSAYDKAGEGGHLTLWAVTADCQGGAHRSKACRGYRMSQSLILAMMEQGQIFDTSKM